MTRSLSPGLTLTEALAVVVLLGVVASVAAVGLARPAMAARVDAAFGAALDLDQRARLAAAREGPMRLSVVADESRQRLVLWAERTDAAIAAVPVDAAIEIQLLPTDAGDNRAEDIRFDVLGHSIDYAITIRTDDLTERRRVAGLTGWVVDEAVAP